jgi:hypothetical protein
MKMRRGTTVLALMLAVLLVAISGCRPSEPELIDGILQNIDEVNGKVTIVTEDGETVTLDIDIEAQVETGGASSKLGTLQIGASEQEEVNENGQAVQRIEARQAEVEGIIVGIDGSEITIESENGQRTTVLVTDSTRIESEDDEPTDLAGLNIGGEVETKYDPESGIAFIINDKEESEEPEEETVTDEDEESDEDEEVVAEGVADTDEETVTDEGGEAEAGISTDEGTVGDEDVGGDGGEEEELKPDVEPSVDGEVVPGGNADIEGDAVPGGDVDIDGDGRITIVDVVGGLEAERARLAEAIAENRISGYYDAEWIRNAEAERERLAEEIERALSDDTYIVVIDGRWVIMDVEPTGDLPGPVIDDPPDDGDHDDGDDHGGDDHPDDGDDHGGDDHPDDGGDDHS